MINIILCGGSGTRLWPLSRELKPKQFIPLVDDLSLFQTTALGNKKYCSQTVVVSNLDHYYLAQKQLEACSIVPSGYILEPVPRNTAAACCLAALSIVDKERILLFTPADHLINYSEDYDAAIKKAKALASDNHVVLFGILPHTPETGYGYIEVAVEDVVKFHEKPNREQASQYLLAGSFFWNSGMICSKAGVLLNAIKRHVPEIYEASIAAFEKGKLQSVDKCIKIPQAEMEAIPSDSIDFAVLERLDSLKMVSGQFRWSDLGSFDSLFCELPKDREGNALDTGSFLSINSKNNLVVGNSRMITAIDVDELVIVDTEDALLIAKRGSTQKVKEIVSKLKTGKEQYHRVHKEETRPWGSFSVLESSDKFKVKKIVVNPGKRLSLQKHVHRSEHWTVVKGTGQVTLGDNIHILHPNQSIYIPAGEMHRIENPGKIDLVFVEVQCGDYTGEDDIMRFEDDFARVGQ